MENSVKSPPAKSDRSLKNILVNTDYQIRYSLMLIISCLGLAALLTAVSFFYLSEHYVPLINQAVTEDLKNQLLAEVQEIAFYLVLATFGSVFLIIIGGIVISHRVAGPMYHLRRVCDEIRAGDFKARAHFRTKDEFKEVAASFNKMLDKLTENKK